MFARCHGPIWRSDDFSTCFQHDYLQTLFPLIFTAVSLIVLLVQRVRKALQSEYYKAYRLLNSHHVWDFQTPHPNDRNEENDDATDATGIEDEIDRNAELALRPTVSTVNRTCMVQPHKPRAEVLVVTIEVLAVLGEVAIAITALLVEAWGRDGTVAAVAGIVSWVYILIIALWRLFLSSSERFSIPQLWYHTACLYGAQWIMKVFRFRSTLLHPRSHLSQALMISSFILVTILLVIVLSSRKGNKVVHLEYEGDIPPAREQVASIFSLASFSWADSIVWRGYQKPVEMADVWNLVPKEKAAAVLADYRQFKKTSRLAWHLVKYFKGGLLVQGMWAALSGFLIFAPTLLLRAILRYIERPEESPRSSAWFFVILLFVSGAGSALADGQALWIGRKTCIQLRAVIIGELYSKALKRKAGTSTEKVLGEKKEAKLRRGWWDPLMLIGRNKKKYQQQKPSDKKVLGDPNSQVTAGAVINLMAVDSFKVSEVSAYLHFLWASTPVQLTLAIVLLYLILGYSCIAGIFMMILLAPVNVLISKRFAAIQTKILAATDGRIHTTNEVLSNIRVIKYFAWEQRFMNLVNEKRTVELKYLRTRYILWSTAATIWGGVPILITLLSFALYTMVEKKDLIPSVAFTALSLFQILRIPLDYMADMVAHVQESKVSVDRVEEFLNEEDTEKYKQLHESGQDESHPAIGFDKGTFTWGGRNELEDDTSFRMLDLNVRFSIGQLNVIAGPTGSGKTSLLMALLGEMTLVEGSVHLPGARSREDMSRDPETGLTESVAYCAQQAWLVNDSLKQNILFATPYDSKRYKDVLRACSLEKDLEILDHGDETLIGEKGVTLSGGQKQRISLARALYCDARHVILDDILSAVDSHTAKWIFDHAIMGPLMYNRTCLLVTHNVALCLPHADFAVVLENGRITAKGSSQDVINSGKLDQDLTHTPTSSKVPSRAHSIVASRSSLVEDTNGSPEEMNNRGVNGNAATNKLSVPSAGPAKATHTSSALAMQEGKATGSVKLNIIVMYLKSMGRWYFWAFAAFIFGAQQLASVATNVWIREWANAYATKEFVATEGLGSSPVTYVRGISGPMSCHSTGACSWNFPFFRNSSLNTIIPSNQYHLTSSSDVNPGYYLGVYAVIGALFMIITFLREGTLFYGSLAASKRIHKRLMETVSHAKFRFFDTTPLGQIMNRFSKDIENVDQEIAPVAVGVVHCLASILTIVIVISVITPGFLIAGFFITLMYYFIGKFYISSSRDLKRLESIQRSPLYQLFGETLSGMTTIRAYGDERRFIRENLNRVNTHNRPFIYVWATNRWLAFRVDITGALVSFFAGIFVVLSVGKIDAGAAGLALSYAVQFTESVLWFVRLYSTNEQNMNSVERIKEYLDVEQEAPAILADNRPRSDWPSQGAVEFVNYSTRYRKDFDLVLRDVSLKISPCQKVGVVGRTGAGKSSLALALFRALEAESGQILIDGLDIGTIGLQDLRENIVMVPQDPTLFSGTIRSNLDPFGLFSDEEIFTALRRVQLIGNAASSRPGTPAELPQNRLRQTAQEQSFSRASSSSTAVDNSAPPTPTTGENKNIFLSLSSTIAESGTNLSQGQRQLLCLARALLKSPKVLLMDEATASIDYSTDSKIQETIRELKNNTIITIAHRLKTIIDYDRVVVMERGQVVEVGEPWELLRPSTEESMDEGGKRWFREMCETSGEWEILEREAKKSWQARRLVDDS